MNAQSVLVELFQNVQESGMKAQPPVNKTASDFRSTLEKVIARNDTSCRDVKPYRRDDGQIAGRPGGEALPRTFRKVKMDNAVKGKHSSIHTPQDAAIRKPVAADSQTEGGPETGKTAPEVTEAIETFASILGIGTETLMQVLERLDIKPEQFAGLGTGEAEAEIPEVAEKLAEGLGLTAEEKEIIEKLLRTVTQDTDNSETRTAPAGTDVEGQERAQGKDAGNTRTVVKTESSEPEQSNPGKTPQVKTEAEKLRHILSEADIAVDKPMEEILGSVRGKMILFMASGKMTAGQNEKTNQEYMTANPHTVDNPESKLPDSDESNPSVKKAAASEKQESTPAEGKTAGTGTSAETAEGNDTGSKESGLKENNPKNAAAGDKKTHDRETGNTQVKESAVKGTDKAESSNETVLKQPVHRPDAYTGGKFGKHLADSITQAVKDNIVQKNEILSQVIDKAKVILTGDKSEMVVDLKPDSLGRLSLKIVTERGMVMAKFTAESQQVKEILESNMQLLKDSLEKQGMLVQGFSVSVGDHSSTGNTGRKMEYGRPETRKTTGVDTAGREQPARKLASAHLLNSYLWSGSSVDYMA